jgi:hypothetical protein
MFRVATVPCGPGRPHYQGFIITQTPHLVGHFRTSDQPDTKTSTYQRTTRQQTDIHASGGILSRNPSKQTAVDPRLGSHGHWHYFLYT